MRIVGLWCVVSVLLVIFDLVRFLPELPAHWWSPEQPPRMGESGMQFDLRVMWVDFGLAWLGSWGYLTAFVWIPVAVIKVVRASRRGLRPATTDWILLGLLATLLCGTSALYHLTPLRYPQYNIPLL